MRSTIQIRGISPLLRGSLFLGLSGSRANLQSSICFPLIKVPFTQKLVRSITGHCPLYLPKVQFAQKASGINNRALLSHTLHTPVLIHQLYELDVRRNNYCMLHQHPRYPLLAPHTLNSAPHTLNRAPYWGRTGRQSQSALGAALLSIALIVCRAPKQLELRCVLPKLNPYPLNGLCHEIVTNSPRDATRGSFWMRRAAYPDCTVQQ